jgi:hypothetical protein
MDRADWPGSRTDEGWLRAFGFPQSGFVSLLSWPQAERESAALHAPGTQMLRGIPDPADPPGDLDPVRCFIIGFVDDVDFCIAVDTRPAAGPSLIHEAGGDRIRYRTAFASLDAFAAFYRARHGP